MLVRSVAQIVSGHIICNAHAEDVTFLWLTARNYWQTEAMFDSLNLIWASLTADFFKKFFLTTSYTINEPEDQWSYKCSPEYWPGVNKKIKKLPQQPVLI